MAWWLFAVYKPTTNSTSPSSNRFAAETSCSISFYTNVREHRPTWRHCLGKTVDLVWQGTIRTSRATLLWPLGSKAQRCVYELDDILSLFYHFVLFFYLKIFFYYYCYYSSFSTFLLHPSHYPFVFHFMKQFLNYILF